jgi:hypothetical protein
MNSEISDNSPQYSDVKRFSKEIHHKALVSMKKDYYRNGQIPEEMSWLLFELLEKNIQLILHEDILHQIEMSAMYMEFTGDFIIKKPVNIGCNYNKCIHFLMATKVMLAIIHCHCVSQLENVLDQDIFRYVYSVIALYFEKYDQVVKSELLGFKEDEDGILILVGMFLDNDKTGKRLAIPRIEAIAEIFEKIGLNQRVTKNILLKSREIRNQWMEDY